MHVKKIPLSRDTLYYTGPDLNDGKKDTLFYFSLTGDESLTLDPYNQIVQCLEGKDMRVFSLTLPGHGDDLDPRKAIQFWSEAIENKKPIFEEFFSLFDEALLLIDHSIQRLFVAGLSRGAWIAGHIAAKHQRVEKLLGFAPLIDLAYQKEFSHMQENPFVKKMHLENATDSLSEKKVRFYSGNLDTKTGTHLTFSLIEKLARKAQEKGRRDYPFEMIITPSIGREGHGTPFSSFEGGAEWIQQ